MKSVLLLYPNQLYPAELLPKEVDQVVLIEEPLLFGTDSKYPLYLHKQKLVFLRACMRRYMEEVLWPAGYQVDYVEFHQMRESEDIANKLVHFDQVSYFDVNDDVLGRRLQGCITNLEHAPSVTLLPSPNFFLKKEEIEAFFNNKQKANFSNFYQWQRERFNILINPETFKPEGGKLTFDSENRNRLPDGHNIPTFQVFGSNEFVEEAKNYVLHHFPDNPGSIDDFPWPTNNHEATIWLDDFVENRLDDFGPYQDALDGSAPWINHSALSAVLNVGLLSPQEVVDRALERHEKKPVPLQSIEAFVRQLLGWREFIRGVYIKKHVQLRTANVFNHDRHMTADWYNGTTGIPPVDDVIKKTLSRSYSHHIERLMVIGNIMFLCEFHPDEVYRWFSEMYIDAYDWVMVPNIYGMSQYADGGSMSAKPYISSSNYILSMSHYDKGEWCNVWDGLYWRFIEKNQELLKNNPHMSADVEQLHKLNENKKRIIGYRADDFLKEKTTTFLK